MPTKPKTPCNHPRCPRLTNGRYCEEHQRAAYRRQNKGRPSPASQGYDHRWAKISKQVRIEEPWCGICERSPSEMTDHLIPKTQGGTDDRWNLWGLCSSCHSRKTRIEEAVIESGCYSANQMGKKEYWRREDEVINQ